MTIRNEKFMRWLTFFTAIFVFYVWFTIIKACGIAPPKKTVVIQQSIEIGYTCEGSDGNPTRKIDCEDDLVGEIIEACNVNGSWVPVVDSCKDPGADIVLDLSYVEGAKITYLTNLKSDVDRRNTFFFNLSHRYAIEKDLKGGYAALNRALNSISFEQNLVECEKADALGVLCAIDIRSLGLEKLEIDEIISNVKRPFISKTIKSNIIFQLTGNEISMLHYDDFIAGVFGDANLYYSIMGFSHADQIYSLFGIDILIQIEAVDYACIGTDESAISSAKNTRLICMFEGRVGGRETICHVSFDNPNLEGAERDLFRTPFLDTKRSKNIHAYKASESICMLPNGLHAYFLSDAFGNLQGFAPENIVICKNNQLCFDATISNPIDCMNCHHDGYLPKHDVIRDHVINSRDFNSQEIELARAIYLKDDEADELFDRHNSYYIDSLSAIGISKGSRNYLVESFNSYFSPQTKDKIAAYLFVSPETLDECINGNAIVSGQIGSLLTNGRVTSDAFNAAIRSVIIECRFDSDPLERAN
jgi:hypothetical protein